MVGARAPVTDSGMHFGHATGGAPGQPASLSCPPALLPASAQLAQQPSNVRSKFKTPDGAWTLHNAKVGPGCWHICNHASARGAGSCRASAARMCERMWGTSSPPPLQLSAAEGGLKWHILSMPSHPSFTLAL